MTQTFDRYWALRKSSSVVDELYFGGSKNMEEAYKHIKDVMGNPEVVVAGVIYDNEHISLEQAAAIAIVNDGLEFDYFESQVDHSLSDLRMKIARIEEDGHRQELKLSGINGEVEKDLINTVEEINNRMSELEQRVRSLLLLQDIGKSKRTLKKESNKELKDE